jgi:hypothetical protein
MKTKINLGGGAKNVKKSSKPISTAHALPSQAEVVKSKTPLPKATPPAAKKVAPPPPAVPNIQIPKVSQSQTMANPAPSGYVQPPSAVAVPPLGKGTAVALPIVPPTGIMKGRTFQSNIPGSIPQPKNNSVIAALPPDKQFEIKLEEYSDQVNNLLEIADSLLDSNWTPEGIVDIIHVMIRALNLDVISLVLPSLNYPEQADIILNRGYGIAPGNNIVDLWLKTFDNQMGIDWKKLMKLAKDTNSDLAYWIVHEGLHSIGYVPIKDGDYIYGFLFVAANGKKEQSALTASLLDLCGSRLGLSYALKLMNQQEDA